MSVDNMAMRLYRSLLGTETTSQQFNERGKSRSNIGFWNCYVTILGHLNTQIIQGI